MPTLHPDIEAVAGDDLLVSGILTDIDGGPLDLSVATLEWVLADPDGKVAASFPGTAELVILDPPTSGKIVVALARDITADLQIGRHSDALRVTAGSRQTMWRGCVLVSASPPWPAPPPQGPLDASSVVVGSPAIGAPTLVAGIDHLG